MRYYEDNINFNNNIEFEKEGNDKNKNKPIKSQCDRRTRQ